MFVVFADEFEEFVDLGRNTYPTLEQAFAQVCCRGGFNYHFALEPEGWRLVLIDGERPECSPDPIMTDFAKPADAKRDLMRQAVDGRLKGHLALPLKDFEQQRTQAMKALAAE
jgi:hypothetical protein